MDITWNKSADTAWFTPHSHRGYTATIALASNTYTITITNGVDADVVVAYETLANAKNAFRKFLFTK